MIADLWLTLVVTCATFGWAGRVFATKTGRDPLRWTVAGVILNIAIVAAMLLAGNRTPKARC